MKTQDNRIHTVHQLDSIYYGQLNSSYQKDSFGIQQTFEFDTYMGYWKNNKTQGLGLIILSNGTIIYANFNRGLIDGLTIIDDGDVILCGIYRNHQIVGVGFQYNYELRLWKMNRYHKGISIQTIKQEYSDLDNGLPKMINVEQSIYYHLYAYVYKQFFPDLGIPISSQIEPGIFCYGLLKDEKNITGPGVYIEDHQIMEAGFYEDNVLHGFGIKSRKNPFSYEFGCYHKGRKDGPFLEKNQSHIRYLQYRKGILLKDLPSSQATILKNQKKFNFNCKDFLSSKNNVPFDEFRQNCQRPEIKNYRQKKKELSEKQKQTNKSPSPNKLSLNKPQFKNSKQQPSNRSYIVGEQKQRSSVQIIRQKMGNFYGIVSGRRRSKQSSPRKSPTKGAEVNNYEDEEIAKQENPFY